MLLAWTNTGQKEQKAHISNKRNISSVPRIVFESLSRYKTCKGYEQCLFQALVEGNDKLCNLHNFINWKGYHSHWRKRPQLWFYHQHREQTTFSDFKSKLLLKVFLKHFHFLHFHKGIRQIIQLINSNIY